MKQEPSLSEAKISALSFLFPLQIEPEHTAFRIDFCDRLLSELYLIQRKQRIDRMKREIFQQVQQYPRHEPPLTVDTSPAVIGNDINHETNISSDNQYYRFNSENISLVTGSISPTVVLTKEIQYDQTCFDCGTLSSLSIFQSPSPISNFYTASTAAIEEDRTRESGPISNRNTFSTTKVKGHTNSGTTDCLCFSRDYDNPAEDSVRIVDSMKLSYSSEQECDSIDDIEDDGLDISSVNIRSPTLRYGRNSGLRRLEEMKKRIEASAVHTATKAIMLEDEIRWDVRLRGHRNNMPKNYSADKITHPHPTSAHNKIRESKMFFFGNRWWKLHFGTAGSTFASKVHNPSNLERINFPYFFYLSPVENLSQDAFLSIEFCIYPPPQCSSMLDTYRRNIVGDICFPGSVSTDFQSTSSKTPPVMHGFDHFISHFDLEPYVDMHEKIRLGVIIRCHLGLEGELLGISPVQGK